MDQRLLTRMQELKDLGGIIGLMTWDQETYLPKKADSARASQLATLQGLYHERLVEKSLGEWLSNAASLSDDEKAMVRVLKHERDRAVRVPAKLVKELAEVQSLAISAWKSAREAEDFKLFEPHLKRLLALRREQADAIGHQGERYDALLENFEPGMTVARLSPVLSALQKKLTPIVQILSAQPKPKDIWAGKTFDLDAQWQFTLELLSSMGFDFDAGRQDRSIHPFTGGTHPLDVRLTTRLRLDTPIPGIFGAIHEGGHGLYEQGFLAEHYRTPIAAAPSMGLHESQSRLWENGVGRSLSFWKHFFPRLQKSFPAALGGVSLDEFHRAINCVEPSLTRVESDEVTYNLHIILRYELELELLRGNMEVGDLPEAWNAKMKSLLGVVPQRPSEGVLQDIHWAWGEFGYFPTYTLGNLYAASLLSAAQKALGDLDTQFASGNFLKLRDWLREQIHREGFRNLAEDLMTRVTGHGIRDDDFIRYLSEKYSALYGVNLPT